MIENQEGEPEFDTIPPLEETGEGASEEEAERGAQSPGSGYPAEGTEPYGGQEGKPESAPSIGNEDQELGQTGHPAPEGDAGGASDDSG